MADPAMPASATSSGGMGGVWVVHSGALGDSILLWPLLRALRRSGREVTLVSRPSHAVLAAHELGVVPVDIDSPAFAQLWIPPSPSAHPHPACPLPPPPIPNPNRNPNPNRPSSFSSPDLLLSFLADPSSPPGQLWLSNAALAFPSTKIHPVGPPASPSRLALWSEMQADTLGSAAARTNPTGPILLHVGAGSRAKRWPLDCWLALADSLRTTSPTTDIHLLAGHVEHEQFTPDERARFAAHHGRFILDDLPALADAIRAARLFIGADSGPTHLAAQLGIPTLALFGPTDPAVWRPIGPAVTVLAPPRPTANMHWLEVDAVVTSSGRRIPRPGPAA